MITEQKPAVTGPGGSGTAAPAPARCMKTEYCRCGQELVGHHREHCPRCGTTLSP